MVKATKKIQTPHVTELIKPRGEAKHKIQTRVDEGEDLVARYEAVQQTGVQAGQGPLLHDDTETWHSVNEQILKQLFSSAEFSNAYYHRTHSTPRPVVAQMPGPTLPLFHPRRSLDGSYPQQRPAYTPPAISPPVAYARAGVLYLKRVIALVENMDEPANTVLSPQTQFPHTFVNNGTVNGIMGTASGTTQTFNFGLQEIEAFADFIERVRQAVPNLPLKMGQEQELDADLSTIENQVKSPRPKWHFIEESLKSVRVVLEEAAGHALAEQLLPQIPVLIAMLQHHHG